MNWTINRQLQTRPRLTSAAMAAGLIFMPTLAIAQAISAAAAATPDRTDITSTALLIAGVMLLLLEIKIVSFGLLGILGTACLAIATGIIWQNGRELWGVSVYYLVPVILLILVLTIWMSVLAGRAYRERVSSGKEGFVGELAEASEPLAPSGRVFFQGAYWQAESCAPVAAGEKVRILGVENLTLYVEPAGAAVAAATAAVCRAAEVNPAD